ncbi:MAG: cupin domain-containing protein [Nitrospinae bacterium]|nr:cupin domain-containing protein [Nitrospinota bacterium]
MGFHRWEDVPQTQNLRKGTMRRAAVLDGLTMQRGEIAPDTLFDESTIHRHPEDQFIIVLEGKLKMHIDGVEEWLESGGFASIPGGVFHSATGVGPEGAKYIEVLSSGRIDYLPGYLGEPKNEFLHQKKDVS